MLQMTLGCVLQPVLGRVPNRGSARLRAVPGRLLQSALERVPVLGQPPAPVGPGGWGGTRWRRGDPGRACRNDGHGAVTPMHGLLPLHPAVGPHALPLGQSGVVCTAQAIALGALRPAQADLWGGPPGLVDMDPVGPALVAGDPPDPKSPLLGLDSPRGLSALQRWTRRPKA